MSFFFCCIHSSYCTNSACGFLHSFPPRFVPSKPYVRSIAADRSASPFSRIKNAGSLKSSFPSSRSWLHMPSLWQQRPECAILTGKLLGSFAVEAKSNADELPGATFQTGANPSIKEYDINDDQKAEADVGSHTFQQEKEKKKEHLKKRVIVGVAIGLGVLGIVLCGGWLFAFALSGAILIASEEYFSMVASHRSMTPPPPYASKVCSAICALMPLLTLYFGGREGFALTGAAFILAIVLILQREKPRFSQLSSVVFGLFYCGYLPCFWVKLRCCFTVPALKTGWPVLLGGHTHWTVGLLATFISFSSIIAADTGAFIGGKFFGRTPLSSVSPKKTFEGAGAGLTAAIAASTLLAKLFDWPSSMLSAAGLGVLIFLASLFGDLTESLIKRDVGVKDSGGLIPGHGGILDRSDSYIFTGSLVYFFVKFGLSSYGL